MAEKDVEIILTRQLAEYLSTPVFIVDPAGALLFYNEAAEGLIGQRFEETGEMPAGEWSTVFTPTDDTGAAIPPEQLPLMIAVAERRPAFRQLWIRALNQVPYRIEVAAFPLIGLGGRFLGAVAVFLEAQTR